MSNREKSESLIRLEQKFGAHNYAPLEVVISRAEGVWVWDAEGRRYMDCLAAYSAVNQGHCHPRLIRTLEEQSHRATLTFSSEGKLRHGVACDVVHMDVAVARLVPNDDGKTSAIRRDAHVRIGTSLQREGFFAPVPIHPPQRD